MQQQKERPILFNSAMVRAILEGRKTQTRRVIKPQPNPTHEEIKLEGQALTKRSKLVGFWHTFNETVCKFGQSGDELYVRESFSKPIPNEFIKHNVPPHVWHEVALREYGVHYWADGDPEYGTWGKPQPSIHMPREFSRIQLKITNIKVEKLQDISEEDAIAEGLRKFPHKGDFAYAWKDGDNHGHGSARGAFRDLWDSIKGSDAWDSNPWLWAIEFERIG